MASARASKQRNGALAARLDRRGNVFLRLLQGFSCSPEIESRPNCLLVRMQKRRELADMKHDRNDTMRVP